jgi:hypothetical protein
MQFRLFDNRILTTPKCGTRYLSKKWSSIYFNSNKFNNTDWNILDKNFLNIQYLIIREPFEHFKTALHTEFYNHKDLYNYGIDLKNYLDKLVLGGNAVHWSYNMYQTMYWLYIKSNKKIKIIHLSFLTDFMKEQGFIIPYDPSNYTFSNYENWMSKDDFFNKLLEEFPTQMRVLLKQVDEQTIFYNKIVNNTTEAHSLI